MGNGSAVSQMHIRSSQREVGGLGACETATDDDAFAAYAGISRVPMPLHVKPAARKLCSAARRIRKHRLARPPAYHVALRRKKKMRRSCMFSEDPDHFEGVLSSSHGIRDEYYEDDLSWDLDDGIAEVLEN